MSFNSSAVMKVKSILLSYTVNDSPQPQVAFVKGLLNSNPSLSPLTT